MKRINFIAVVVCLYASLSALGQSSNATVSGTVVDATGAVVPGVTITATNNATGVVTTVQSNDAGAYVFASLLPGTYKVTAGRSGFQTQTYTAVQLGNAAQVRLNFDLKVASVAQSVEVSVSADTLITSSSSSVGEVLPERQVQDLPLVSNNVLDLIGVMAGVTITESPIFGAEQTSFAGVSAGNVNVQRDGVSVNNQRWPNGIDSPTRLSPDLVGEIKMILAPVDAEMGRGNGQVQIQTKSGTNAYHGSAVWDVQNSALDANTWANNAARPRVDPPWRNQHEYTLALGGPIKHNQTFFYGLWDQQISVSRNTVFPTVLTDCARNGIFRYFPGWNSGNASQATSVFPTPTIATVDALGNPVRPATNPDGTPYTGALQYLSVFGQLQNTPTKPDCSDAVVIPNTAWDSNRKALDSTGFVTKTLSYMPHANAFNNPGKLLNIPLFGFFAPDGLNTATDRWVRTLHGSDNLFGIGEPTQRKQFNIKIDHNFTTNHKVNGSYSYERDYADDSYINWPNTFGGKVEKRPQVLAVNFTSTLSPTLVNEARFGISRTGVNVYAPLDNPDTGAALRALLPAAKGLTIEPILGTQAVNFQNQSIIGSRGIFQVTSRDNSPRYTYADTVSWSKGKHAFKFGGEYRLSNTKSTNAGVFFPAAASYPAAIGGNAVLAPVTGIARPGLLGDIFFGGDRMTAENLLTFLSGSLGQVTQFRFINSSTATTWNDPTKDFFKVRDLHQNEFGFFFKDDWKATRDLTLNLGVRWDYYGVPYEASGLAAALKGGGNALFGLSGRSFNDWMKPGIRGDVTQTIFVGRNSPNTDLSVYPRDTNNFGPAVGFAYQVPWLGQGKTTVRGGYQIQYVGFGRGFALDTAIGNPPGSSAYPFFDNGGAYMDLTKVAAAVPVEPNFAPLRPIPVTDRNQPLNAFDPNYVTPYVQNLTLSITRNVTSKVSVDLRYIGTLSRKLYSNIDLDAPNFLFNGLKEAFDAARAGGESALLDNMFRGLNIAGAGFGAVGSTVNGVFQTGALQLRAATAGNIRNNLANGNYSALATTLNTLQIDTFNNPSVPAGIAGLPGAVLRYTRNFPENFIKTNPQLSNATLETNLGHSNYHSLQTQVSLRPTAGVSLQGTYTWSRNLGVAPAAGANGQGAVFSNPVDRNGDYTLLGSHREHAFRTYGNFDLPIGPNKLVAGGSSGVLARIIEGWQASWIVNLTSGSPTSVTAQSMLYGLGVPDIVGPFNFEERKVTWKEGDPSGNYFANAYTRDRDPQCTNSSIVAPVLQSLCTLNGIKDAKTGQYVLVNPLPGKRGTFGQNRFENLGVWTADMAIAKRIRFAESKTVQVRLDATNIFNHPTPAGQAGFFGPPPLGQSDLNINGTNPFGYFGNKWSPSASANNGTAGNRTFQLKARVEF